MVKRRDKRTYLDVIDETRLKIPIVVALLACFGFYWKASEWSDSGKYKNLVLYFFSVTMFFIVLAVGAFLYAVMRDKVIGKRFIIMDKLFALGSAPVGGWFLTQCYYNELDMYAYPASYIRHQINPVIYKVLLIMVSVLVYFAIIANEKNNRSLWRFVFSIFVAFCQSWFLYVSNPFKDNGGGIYHIDAYTNSIINRLAYAPYEQYSNSIYGHYGLMYLVPIKIIHRFGLSYWSSLAIVISVVGLFTFCFEYWCFSQLIRNDAVFSVAVLANAIVSFQIYSGQYFQMMPHRYLFQGIILSGCIISFRKMHSKMIRAIMWGLSGFSMLWNIETGIILTIAWCVSSIYLDAKRKSGNSFWILLSNGCSAIFSFVFGYVILNLYNIIVGGKLIGVSTYIYPIGSQEYRIDSLQLPLMNPCNGYFLVISLMLGIIGLYLMDGIKLRMREDRYIAFIAAVMGLGLFTYYMNRAVTTNASIVAFSVVLLISHLCDRFVPIDLDKSSIQGNFWQRLMAIAKVRNVVGLFCLLVLSGMAMASVVSFGSTIKNKIGTTWETDSLSEFLAEAERAIPSDAVAFGSITAQLYSLMDRKTGIYISDWEDMNQDGLARLSELLQDNMYEHVVVSSGQSDYLPKEKYELISNIEYAGVVFEIYERKENVL